jgi:4-hydroxy-tetrahydrodipicolinate synthase
MLTRNITALITPMEATGAIDYAALERLINHQIQSGTAALVILGTTGEAPTLTARERWAVIQASVTLAAGRIPIIAGTGSSSTAEAIAWTQQLEDSGVAACLAGTPYYNKPTQEGLLQHFTQIACQSQLPQILYNVPSRTGCDLQPETIARLAELPTIIGVKEATGDLSRVSRLRALLPKPFILLSGDDISALDFMRLGGDGVISVTANVAASALATLCQLAFDAQWKQAEQLNQQLYPLHQALFIESNPIPVKWACHHLGLITSNTLRLPLTPLSAHAQQPVESALSAANLLPSLQEQVTCPLS